MIALFFFGIGSMVLFSLAATMLTEFMPRKSSAGVAVSLCVLGKYVLVKSLLILGLAQQLDEERLRGCRRHCRHSCHSCNWKWLAIYHSRNLDISECLCGVVDEALWAKMACQYGQKVGMRLTQAGKRSVLLHPHCSLNHPANSFNPLVV